MDRWRVGEDTGSKEMDRCPLISKLSHRRLGPFVVEACVGQGAYCLKLPY
jgi:hypothetical protein